MLFSQKSAILLNLFDNLEHQLYGKNVIKQYFEDWFVSIKQLDDNFSKTVKNKKFVSQQIHKGLKITANSVTRGFFLVISFSASSQIHFEYIVGTASLHLLPSQSSCIFRCTYFFIRKTS